MQKNYTLFYIHLYAKYVCDIVLNLLPAVYAICPSRVWKYIEVMEILFTIIQSPRLFLDRERFVLPKYSFKSIINE